MSHPTGKHQRRRWMRPSLALNRARRPPVPSRLPSSAHRLRPMAGRECEARSAHSAVRTVGRARHRSGGETMWETTSVTHAVRPLLCSLLSFPLRHEQPQGCLGCPLSSTCRTPPWRPAIDMISPRLSSGVTSYQITCAHLISHWSRAVGQPSGVSASDVVGSRQRSDPMGTRSRLSGSDEEGLAPGSLRR